MEFNKLWEERNGKLTAEIVEKITENSSWIELEIFRLFKDKEQKWKRAYGISDRDAGAYRQLAETGTNKLLELVAKPKAKAAAPAPVGEMVSFDDDDIPF